MADKYSDRRQYRRIYFAIEDKVIGIFKFADKSSEPFEANILNLSSGGVHFSQDKNKKTGIIVEDKLFLLRIEGKEGLNFEFNVELTVKWILGHESLKHVGYGGEFQHASKWLMDRITRYVKQFYPE